jgi:hypothetical protein
MAYDDVRSALEKDTMFTWRPADVSYQNQPQENAIESTGRDFIERGVFQFDNGHLSIMTFTFSLQLLDYYSVFTTFVNKYGEPALLSPLLARWENSDVYITIEKPLTVKYTSRQPFDASVQAARNAEGSIAKQRADFLAEF